MLDNCLMKRGLTVTDMDIRLFYAASAEGFNVYVLVRFRGHFVSPVGLPTSSCFHGCWLYGVGRRSARSVRREFACACAGRVRAW